MCSRGKLRRRTHNQEVEQYLINRWPSPKTFKYRGISSRTIPKRSLESGRPPEFWRQNAARHRVDACSYGEHALRWENAANWEWIGYRDRTLSNGGLHARPIPATSSVVGDHAMRCGYGRCRRDCCKHFRTAYHPKKDARALYHIVRERRVCPKNISASRSSVV